MLPEVPPATRGEVTMALLDAAPVLVAAADRSGRIALFNAACERLTGFPREDVLGKPFFDTLVPPSWHTAVRERFSTASPAELATPHVNPWLTRAGESLPIEWHCFRIQDVPDGPWIVGFGHDIATLSGAREEIRRQQQLLDAIFEHIPTGITVADAPDVTIRRVSRYGEALTGQGREVLEHIPAEQHAGTWGLVRGDGGTPAANELPLTRATRQGEIVNNEEWVLVRPDGQQLVLLCNAAPIRDSTGRITGGLIAWRDITDRKMLEQALQRRADELAAAIRAKDDFLATVAHELRQPLSACLAALQLMATRSGRDMGVRARLVAERQVQRMSRLVEDLLDASRVVRGDVTLRYESIPLRELVQHAVEVVRPLLDERQHTFSESWPVGSGVVIDADPDRLQQVLVNLLTNAARYTDAGGSVVLDVQNPDGLVKVSVRDSGRGIPPESQPYIFDLFRRANGDEDGFGIGLAAARRIVELHGGTIEVHSQGHGLGSEFIVTLPAGNLARPPQPVT